MKELRCPFRQRRSALLGGWLSTRATWIGGRPCADPSFARGSACPLQRGGRQDRDCCLHPSLGTTRSQSGQCCRGPLTRRRESGIVQRNRGSAKYCPGALLVSEGGDRPGELFG